MYIRKVSLQNWKNFKTSSATLSKRVFLIGPNASGKSNFLDAFRFLRDLAGIGLGQAVSENRGGVSAIRCLSARESPNIAVEVVISEDSNVDSWSYRIEINQDAFKRPIVRQEQVIDLQSKQILLNRPEPLDKEDPIRLTQTALEQIIANRGFRPVAEFFSTISYHHLVPQVVRDPKGFTPSPVSNDPFGRDLLLRIYGTDSKVRNARLKRISYVLRQAVPQLHGLEIEMDPQGTPHLIGRHEHWRAHGAKHNESQFSDGTLRLFGLMWSMLEGNGPLLIEEPELSLHPEVVRSLPQMFVQLQEEIRRMRKKSAPGRQIIISTHSDDMLSDTGIGPQEVIRIESGSEGSRLVTADALDQQLMSSGLSAADVLLPKSNPTNGQLKFDFK